MRNRVPVTREGRAPVPAFAPVPRKFGMTGGRPRGNAGRSSPVPRTGSGPTFIEALADTGSVSRAAAQVNMAQANRHTLRREAYGSEIRATV